jgi:hypothetical protein
MNNTKFRATFHKLVWNVHLKPSTFEERWRLMIEEYGLMNNDWLSNMFERRQDWVPGYFRDLPMCCLMKTTSRCESTNHLFKVNSTPTNTLVEFLLCFDSTLDHQRYIQRMNEIRSTTTTPTFHTLLPIERNASLLYTRDIFKEVQKEILKSTNFCYIVTRAQDDTKFSYTIAHQDHRRDIINEYSVSYNLFIIFVQLYSI